MSHEQIRDEADLKQQIEAAAVADQEYLIGFKHSAWYFPK